MTEKKAINYKSCFDIIGPIMVGPSSSHTAGAVQLGLLARQLFGGTPKEVCCTYYESFAETHLGHGTDYAIVSGVLGFATDDTRVPQAVDIAKSQGITITFIEKEGESPINHANTADLWLSDEEHTVRLVGASVGGGTVEVRAVEVDGIFSVVTGPLPVIVLLTAQEERHQRLLEELKNQEIEVLKVRHEKDLYVYELGSLLTRVPYQHITEVFKRDRMYILNPH